MTLLRQCHHMLFNFHWSSTVPFQLSWIGFSGWRVPKQPQSVQMPRAHCLGIPSVCVSARQFDIIANNRKI